MESDVEYKYFEIRRDSDTQELFFQKSAAPELLQESH